MSEPIKIRPLIWQAWDGEMFCCAQCAADKGHTAEDLGIVKGIELDTLEIAKRIELGLTLGAGMLCHCGKELG